MMHGTHGNRKWAHQLGRGVYVPAASSRSSSVILFTKNGMAKFINIPPVMQGPIRAHATALE